MGKKVDQQFAKDVTSFLARIKLMRATLEDVYHHDVPRWENIVIDDPLHPEDRKGVRGRDPSGFVPNPPHKDP